MTIEITQDRTGITVSLRVQPKASRNTVVGEHAGSLKLSVTAPPEKGKANQAVVKLLAKMLKVPAGSIMITGGATSRQKKIHINGIKADEFRKILEATR